MRLDAVTAEIRPRSDWEAVDLGLAMVRRDFWRCFAVWWLALVVPTALAGWWLWDRPAWWLMLFWWWKPAGSRLVLFELSRRLFGERPGWRGALHEIPRAWTRRFFHRFVWARLSPWLPVMLAVEDLEGLTGKVYKQRRSQMTRRAESVVMWLFVVSDMAACWFGLAILVLVLMFIPEGQDGAWRMAAVSWDAHDPASVPLLIMRTVTACVMLAMSLTDVFVTGAGFGVYLNNRTWLEGWDVELAFRRLARRLTKIAMLGMALWTIGQPAMAGPAHDPSRWIREIKADEAFKVHTQTVKVPQPWNTSFSWSWPEWLKIGDLPDWLGSLATAAVLALILGAILWLLWKYRRVWMHFATRDSTAPAPPQARVVMGMAVAPQSLPADVPAAARALWRQGRRQDALGLLYRGAISRVMQVGRVEIQESDTEGDCLRRVDQTGPAAHPEYFRSLTSVWSRMAYAGHCPEDLEVETLCRQWPFEDRRDG
jgi:hypothetical protein